MKDYKIIWLQYARATACILVILLHISSNYVNNYGIVNLSDWRINNYIDSFSRSCVPIFFMISGYFFFGVNYPKAKNFIKLVSAFLFYSILAIVFYLIASLVFPSFNVEVNYNFITQPAMYHLWFFYPMIMIYFLACLVSIKKINSKVTIPLIIFFFVFLNKTTYTQLNELIGFEFKSLFVINSDFFTLCFTVYLVRH